MEHVPDLATALRQPIVSVYRFSSVVLAWWAKCLLTATTALNELSSQTDGRLTVGSPPEDLHPVLSQGVERPLLPSVLEVAFLDRES